MTTRKRPRSAATALPAAAATAFMSPLGWKSPSAAAGSDISWSRQKITGYERALGLLSHGLRPFYAVDLHPALVVVARPATSGTISLP